MTTEIYKCKKCGHTEFRDSAGPHYCKVLITYQNLFDTGKHMETCTGEMEAVCQSTDTDAPSADEKKST